MSEILGNIYIWVFSINSEIGLLLALVKYMLCSHFTQKCWKSYICVFILSKKRRNCFHKNLHNSGMVGHRELPDPLLNRIFNALSIGVQYTLWFQWTNFGLKCLFIIRAGNSGIWFFLLFRVTNSKTILKFFHIELLTRKIKKTRF